MDKPYVVGMDIGGTNSVFGIVDARGNILSVDSIKTQAYREIDEYVNAVAERLNPMIEAVGGKEKIKGMGIGAPNGNFYSGTIEFAPNLPWKGVIRLADLFSAAIGVPVTVTNDANAAAIGEMTYGAARGMKNFIEITLGTGVGSGIVVNGQLVYGHDGFAGEFGHVIVERGGRQCGCGRRGCLESYTSAGGIKRTAFELMATMNDPSPLREYSFDQLEAAMLSRFAAEGDPIAKECFRLTGQKLGYALADAVTITSPEAIFLFGGLAKAGDLIFGPIKHYMEENMLFAFKNKVKVLPSGLQNKNAAILGASALVWQNM